MLLFSLSLVPQFSLFSSFLLFPRYLSTPAHHLSISFRYSQGAVNAVVARMREELNMPGPASGQGLGGEVSQRPQGQEDALQTPDEDVKEKQADYKLRWPNQISPSSSSSSSSTHQSIENDGGRGTGHSSANPPLTVDSMPLKRSPMASRQGRVSTGRTSNSSSHTSSSASHMNSSHLDASSSSPPSLLWGGSKKRGCFGRGLATLTSPGDAGEEERQRRAVAKVEAQRRYYRELQAQVEAREDAKRRQHCNAGEDYRYGVQNGVKEADIAKVGSKQHQSQPSSQQTRAQVYTQNQPPHPHPQWKAHPSLHNSHPKHHRFTRSSTFLIADGAGVSHAQRREAELLEILQKEREMNRQQEYAAALRAQIERRKAAEEERKIKRQAEDERLEREIRQHRAREKQRDEEEQSKKKRLFLQQYRQHLHQKERARERDKLSPSRSSPLVPPAEDDVDRRPESNIVNAVEDRGPMEKGRPGTSRHANKDSADRGVANHVRAENRNLVGSAGHAANVSPVEHISPASNKNARFVFDRLTPEEQEERLNRRRRQQYMREMLEAQVRHRKAREAEEKLRRREQEAIEEQRVERERRELLTRYNREIPADVDEISPAEYVEAHEHSSPRPGYKGINSVTQGGFVADATAKDVMQTEGHHHFRQENVHAPSGVVYGERSERHPVDAPDYASAGARDASSMDDDSFSNEKVNRQLRLQIMTQQREIERLQRAVEERREEKQKRQLGQNGKLQREEYLERDTIRQQQELGGNDGVNTFASPPPIRRVRKNDGFADPQQQSPSAHRQKILLEHRLQESRPSIPPPPDDAFRSRPLITNSLDRLHDHLPNSSPRMEVRKIVESLHSTRLRIPSHLFSTLSCPQESLISESTGRGSAGWETPTARRFSQGAQSTGKKIGGEGRGSTGGVSQEEGRASSETGTEAANEGLGTTKSQGTTAYETCRGEYTRQTTKRELIVNNEMFLLPEKCDQTLYTNCSFPYRKIAAWTMSPGSIASIASVPLALHSKKLCCVCETLTSAV